MKAEYKIIGSDDREELSAQVSRFLNEGWNLAGGVAVDRKEGGQDMYDVWYCQAVVFWPDGPRRQNEL